MSTTIFVKCVSTNDLQWRESGSNDWQQLTADKSDAPTIDVMSTAPVTFQFLKDSSSAHGVDYKQCPSCDIKEVHSKSGPVLPVNVGSGNTVYFARDESAKNQRWYAGHVQVSRPDED